MTENTAGKLVRPTFDDAYNDMTGLEDEAITEHLGYDIEELFERLNDNALSTRQWGQLIQALEFLRLRKEHPDALAAQLVREMPRRQIAEFLDAWFVAIGVTGEGDEIDPDSPEGKDASPSETSASPAGTPEPTSDEPSSGSSD